MSREALYMEYASRILKAFPSWPKDQDEMERFLQLVVICTEKCTKTKKHADFVSSNTVWLAYSKAYKERYKLEPPTSPLNYRHAKNLMTALGHEQAALLVEFYLKQNDSWYVKNYHSLSTLIANQTYQGLYTRMKTGLQVSDKTSKSLEKATNTAKASMDYLTKKHGEKK